MGRGACEDIVDQQLPGSGLCLLLLLLLLLAVVGVTVVLRRLMVVMLLLLLLVVVGSVEVLLDQDLAAGSVMARATNQRTATAGSIAAVCAAGDYHLCCAPGV